MKKYNKYDSKHVDTWKKLHGVALKALGYKLKDNDILSWNCSDDWDLDEKPFSGQVLLKVTMGFLRNKEISKEDRDYFKNSILPELHIIDESLTTQFNGFIVCHVRDDDLQNVDVNPNK